MRIQFDLTTKEAATVARIVCHLIDDSTRSSNERAALEKVQAALADNIEAVDRQGNPPGNRYAGQIEWTLEDEAYEPHGRQFDVRVFYNWVDFDPGDEMTPPSGGHAEIAAIELLGVSYFNARGEVIAAAEHELAAAWDLIAKVSSSIETACSADGKSGGMVAGELQGRFAGLPTLRRAPSTRERFPVNRRRASG